MPSPLLCAFGSICVGPRSFRNGTVDAAVGRGCGESFISCLPPLPGGIYRGGGSRLIAVLRTALVAFHTAVLEFLGEFRIDGWGYAIATWSIVWYLRSRRIWRYAAFG